MLHHNKLQNAFNTKRGYRGLFALLMVVGLVSLFAGCVQSENGITLEGPKGAECTYEPLVLAKVDGTSVVSTLIINLADYEKLGPLLGIEANKGKPTYHWGSPNAPIKINLTGKNSLNSTLSNTSIGAGKELRINQNGFIPSKISYTITDDQKLGLKISPKSLSGFNIQTNTDFSILGVDFLSSDEASDWSTKLAASGADSKDIQVTAQLKGKLGGGQSIKSTIIRFTVRLINTSTLDTTTMVPKITELGNLSTPLCNSKT